jgi:PAS domain S-box-containing protein
LYAALVMLAGSVFTRRGVIAVALICSGLALLSHFIVYGTFDEIFVRTLVCICAIAITAFLTVKSQQAALALREKATLLDLAQDAIFICDMDDVITYWNAGAEELYGWERAHALGQKAEALLKTQYTTPRPDIIQETERTGQWRGEIIHTARDGTQLILDSRWLLQHDETGRPLAIMKTYNDITKRKAADAKIRAAERELREAIETIPGMVWSVSPDESSMAFIQYNGADAGLKVVESDSQNGSGVHPDDLGAAERDWRYALSTGSPFEATCRVRTAGGSYRWLLVRAAPMKDDQGKILRWYGINTDIEDKRRAEDDLNEARAELSHFARVATLGELTASIAHEVNQPLAAIVTNGQAALRWLGRQDPDLDEVKGSVERIVNNGRRASDVVDRLRALARKGMTKRGTLTVEELVDDILPLVQRELHRHRVVLNVDWRAPPAVIADKIQLQQVMINLIVNAAQAMSNVDDRPRVLSIVGRSGALELGEPALILEVRDRGPGIDEDTIASLFKPFFTTKAEGMGMGLSICRSIVEAHGGRISASSTTGEGTCFMIILPVGEDAFA